MVSPDEVGSVIASREPLLGATTGTVVAVDGGLTHLRVRPT